MQNLLAKIKEYLIKLLPLIALATPLVLLYILNPVDSALKISPQNSFQTMWKGRTFELFFIWLVSLEYILSWETIQSKITMQKKARTLLFAVVLLLPSLFVFLEYGCGFLGNAGWVGFCGYIADRNRILGIFASVLFSGVCAFWQKGVDWFCFARLVCWPNRRYLRYRHHFSLRTIYAISVACSHDCLVCRGHFEFDGKHRCNGNRRLNFNADTPSYRCLGDSKVCDSLALRRHREPPYLYGCGSFVLKAYAHFLEGKSRVLHFWSSHHLSH